MLTRVRFLNTVGYPVGHPGHPGSPMSPMSKHMKRKTKKRKSRRLRNTGRRMAANAGETRRERKKAKKRKKYQPRTYGDILLVNRKQLIREYTRVWDMERVFHVAKFTFGFVVECESLDEKKLLERETLFSRDGKVWTLLGRKRSGPTHHDMKWYPRDTIYPVGCKVRL